MQLKGKSSLLVVFLSFFFFLKVSTDIRHLHLLPCDSARKEGNKDLEINTSSRLSVLCIRNTQDWFGGLSPNKEHVTHTHGVGPCFAGSTSGAQTRAAVPFTFTVNTPDVGLGRVPLSSVKKSQTLSLQDVYYHLSRCSIGILLHLKKKGRDTFSF